MAKPTIFVLVPMDAPDPEGMVALQLRPFHVRFAPDNVLVWPYHDYWGFRNIVSVGPAHSYHQCCLSVQDITEDMRAAAVITPDGNFHDCCNPLTWINAGSNTKVSEWNELSKGDLLEYKDCMVAPVWVHC